MDSILLNSDCGNSYHIVRLNRIIIGRAIAPRYEGQILKQNFRVELKWH